MKLNLLIGFIESEGNLSSDIEKSVSVIGV